MERAKSAAMSWLLLLILTFFAACSTDSGELPPKPSGEPSSVVASTSPDVTEPDWAYAPKDAFWKAPADTTAPEIHIRGDKAIMPPALALGEVMMRVRNRFEIENGVPTARAGHYVAEIASNAIRFSATGAADAHSALSLRLDDIAIGGRSLLDNHSDLEQTIHSNTVQQRLSRDTGLVAHSEALPDGLELTWILANKPDFKGDLEIQLEVEGLPYLSKTPVGHHFGNRADKRLIAIGPATAVDAQGRTWPLKSRYDNGLLTYVLEELVISEAQYPLAIDPVVFAEFEIDEPVAGPVENEQYSPSVTSNGDDTFFAVWQDQRSSYHHVYGTRISVSSGEVLDPYGIAIATEDTSQDNPVVAYAPGSTPYYVVTWQHNGNYTKLARVKMNGEVVDTTSISVSETSYGDADHTIACSSTVCLIVWQELIDSNYGLHASTFTHQTGAVSATSITVAHPAATVGAPSVAFDGTNFLVVWDDWRSGYKDIYGVRVTQAGAVHFADPVNGFPICIEGQHQEAPAVAFDGTNYFVVWSDNRGGHDALFVEDIYGRFVSTGGVALGDAAGIQLVSRAYRQQYPSIGWNGVNYLVAWQDWLDYSDDRDIAAQAFDASGSAVTSASTLISDTAGQFYPSVGAAPVVWFVAWQDDRGASYDIYGARIVTSGVNLDVAPANGSLVATSVNSQAKINLASDGSNFLAVWHDTRNAVDNDVYGAIVQADGSVSSSFAIADGIGHQQNPAVDFDGTRYLVVYEDNSGVTKAARYEIQGRFVSTSGVPDVGGEFRINDGTGGAETTPDVCWSSLANAYLVAWKDTYYDVGNILGVRIDAAGNRLEIPYDTIIVNNLFVQDQPRIATSGATWMVTYISNQLGNGYYHVYAARVGSDGGPLDVGAQIEVDATYAFKWSPDIAYNGDGVFWIVYQRDTSGFENAGIYLKRVFTNGTVVDPTPITIANNAAIRILPRIAFDGSRDFLVVWEDYRNASHDIYGSLVSGTTISGSEFAISTGNLDEAVPAAAFNAAGKMLVAYTSESYGVTRAQARLGCVDCCYIAGTVYDDGDVDPDNACAKCDPSVSSTAWSNNAAGSCSDGNACTQNDRCEGTVCTGDSYSCDDGYSCTTDTCNGDGTCHHGVQAGSCLIGEACYANGDDNPSNACQECVSGTSQIAWADKASTESCNDGEDCTQNDHCQSGACVGDSYTCNDDITCTTDSCNGDGTCTFDINASYCLIGGECYQNGDVNPSNPCQVCGIGVSQTSWNNYPSTVTCNDGQACTQNDRCQSGICAGDSYVCNDSIACTDDTCNGDGTCTFDISSNSCYIGGSCYGTGANNPANTCQWCAPTTDQEAWTNKPSTENCNDVDFCTYNDRCQNGVCAGDSYTCDDGLDCTINTCLGDGTCNYSLDGNHCLIEDICYTNGEDNPNNSCQLCDSDYALVAWANKPSTATCDDGEACTQNDHCDTGVCAGESYTCDDSLTCTTDVCDGAGGCTNPLIADACLIGEACYAADATNGTNLCQLCDPDQTTNAWSDKDCDDGVDCTQDNCNAQSGECSHTPQDSECDDENVCTTDSCDAQSGCANEAVADWTDCDSDPESACFAGACEAIPEGDVCENAFVLELDTSLTKSFSGYHIFQAAGESCIGVGEWSGPDVYFKATLDSDKEYRVTVTPESGLDLALVLRSVCESENCLDAVDSGIAGAAEALDVTGETDLYVQVMGLALSRLSGSFDIELTEVTSLDGDEDGDVDGDSDGDTDSDTPDGDEPDGDEPDGDEPDGDTPDGDEPDGDAPDGDTPDGDEPDGDEPSDGDEPVDGDEPSDGDSPADGDDTPADGDDGGGGGGGGCRSVDAESLFGYTLLLIPLLLARRRRSKSA